MKNVKNKKSAVGSDLPESVDDRKHLQPDVGSFDLPDVRDIPGQEHIKVPPLGELADTTISSDDEEGVGIFGEDENDAIRSGPEGNVTKVEQKILRDASEKMPSPDEINLEHAQLDQLDEDGEVLNEKSDLTGSDLDVPGSEDDDANEEIGEEDEENNSYSLKSEDEEKGASR